MKKFITLFLFLFSMLAHANSQDLLDVTQWDFDAIKASHKIFNKSQAESQQQCLQDLKAISWFSQQQGNLIFTSDNCFVYRILKDGWIIKTDMQTKEALAKIRVGLKIANATLSKDDKILLVGNRQPADLVLLNTSDLSVARMIPVKNRKGIYSPVAKVRTANDEQGFIVAPQDFPKIWKINYQNPAPIGFGDGWNHDYRCLKEHVNKTLFPVKRLKIGQLLDDFQIDSNGIFLVGRDQSGKGMIMDLDLSRVIAHPDITKIGAGVIWEEDNAHRLAVLNKDNINIFSNKNNRKKWNIVKTIPVNLAISISSCPNSPVLWVYSKDSKIQLINKNSLDIKETLTLNTPVTQMTCLQNGMGILLKTQQGKSIIFDSKTFKQLL